MRRATDRRHSGFTLVEMIVSIVVAGILIALVAMFGRWQIQSYFDVATRAELTDAADTALRRIFRDLQKALPNSVRVAQAGNVFFLEYVPIADAGRYRAECNVCNGANADDILNFAVGNDTTFEVFGPPVATAAGQELVVYNLGIPDLTGTGVGSDVYQGLNRRAIPAAGVGAALNAVTFTSTGVPFPLPSPANRFHIVDQPVTYECNPNTNQIVRHWGYGFQLNQLTTFNNGQAALLANNVSACNIVYGAAAVLQRNALVSINLSLQANGETVQLMHQVEVLNTP